MGEKVIDIANFSLEGMLLMIARDNSITKFNFVVYKFYEHYPIEFQLPEVLYQKELKVHKLSKRIKEICKKIKKIEKEIIENGIPETAGYYVGISSKVELKEGTCAHMFMIDFDCDVRHISVEEIKEMLQEYGIVPGFILNSGNSYHFYLNGTVSDVKWKDLLEQLRGQEQSLVDEDWVGRQLERGYSVLRISSGIEKPNIPTIVEIVDDITSLENKKTSYDKLNPNQLKLFVE